MTKEQPQILFDKYAVLERLHLGECHETFLAADREERVLVVRRLQAQASECDGDASDLIDAFSAAARINARLMHPGICQTLEYGVADVPYTAREHVSGKNLRDLRRRHTLKRRRIPQPIALHVISEICAALTHAHAITEDDDPSSSRIFHGNLFPRNVLLSFEGHVKLINFVSSHWPVLVPKLEQSVDASRLPPEQQAHKSADARSDVFALGFIAYCLLAGQPPFPDGKDNPTPPPSSVDPEIPGSLDAIVARTLALNPNERYESATQLAKALDKLYASGAVDRGSREDLAALMKQSFAAARRMESARSRKVTTMTRELAAIDSRELAEAAAKTASDQPRERSGEQPAQAVDEAPATTGVTAQPRAAGPLTTPLVLLGIALLLLVTTTLYWFSSTSADSADTAAAATTGAPEVTATGMGLLNVTSEVPVDVLIDDQPEQLTPPLKRQLPIGEHTVTIVFTESKKRMRRQVTVAEGETLRIRLVHDEQTAKSE